MRTLSLLALSAFALAATPAAAQTADWDASFNVGVTSDYIFRGVSQTEEDPAIQGGVDLTNGQVYLGAWASNVSYPGDPDTNAEIDLYGGVRPTYGDWTFDIGAIGYIYTNQPDGADYSYVEAKLGASRPLSDTVTAGLTAFVSPDFFGAAEDESLYLVGDLGWAAVDKLTVSGQLGRQWVSSTFDYTHWNVGAAFALTDAVALDVRYHDTDEDGFGKIYEERVVASLKATF